ncbi:MAG: hypothetical protein A3F72_08095 [Bacteroidetes bacterium RIFCSPLOWO2_12_FULL_35_15]|nr:MAG: hypothetical protein A3F72_08095 [Bacteroidetes bacterium RIFCSPLOWO2_12_FULL_35_15]
MNLMEAKNQKRNRFSELKKTKSSGFSGALCFLTFLISFFVISLAYIKDTIISLSFGEGLRVRSEKKLFYIS